jgi:hypothetical protein
MDVRLPFPSTPSAVQSLGTWMSKHKQSKQQAEVHGYIKKYLTAKNIPRPEKVHEDDGDLYLHADAVVMKKLPSDQDLMVPLMRELLELNARLTESVRLCIANDTVLAMVHRRLTDLSEKDVRDSIEAVMAIADGLDDGFTAKYSGTSRRRATQTARGPSGTVTSEEWSRQRRST